MSPRRALDKFSNEMKRIIIPALSFFSLSLQRGKGEGGGLDQDSGRGAEVEGSREGAARRLHVESKGRDGPPLPSFASRAINRGSVAMVDRRVATQQQQSGIIASRCVAMRARAWHNDETIYKRTKKRVVKGNVEKKPRKARGKRFDPNFSPRRHRPLTYFRSKLAGSPTVAASSFSSFSRLNFGRMYSFLKTCIVYSFFAWNRSKEKLYLIDSNLSSSLIRWERKSVLFFLFKFRGRMYSFPKMCIVFLFRVESIERKIVFDRF